MSLSQSQIVELHSILERDNTASYKKGVEFIAEKLGEKTKVSENEAQAALTSFFHSLLKHNRYVDAAILQWGSRTFDPRPKSVQRIWQGIDDHDKLLCMGAGVQGKTWTPTVKFLLRWSEDPTGTGVKLVSTTGGHAKSNLYAGFVRLHNEAVIPLPGLVRENFISVDINELQFAIQKVSIAPSESGTAALRGIHRLPRKKIHPKFGEMTVIFVIVDEADNVPWGFWKGADNIASGRGEKGSVKIYGATNPMLRESEFASRAEPPNGWTNVKRDQDYDWEGKQGWHVIRLDARESENYKERREVFKGIMTYEAAKEYEAKGKDHPDYWTFVLGLYPTATARYYVVPAFILDNIRGTYNFARTPHNVASFDPAFEEGGDLPILTAGRYGIVNGFRDQTGKLETISPARWALQIEQQFEVEKTANPLDMADNLIEILRKLRVNPEWFVHDQTGNATLLYGYLLRRYGNIMGLKWGSKATETRIFEEDRETAEEQFVGLISEMWFGFSRWAQFGFLKLAPMMQTQVLFNELSSRKYEQASKTMMMVERKQEFKDNNSGRSPDHSDSLIMLPHLCRIRGQEKAQLISADKTPDLPPDVWRGEGVPDRPKIGELVSTVDRIPFLDLNL